jgi:charged multivesicular body protein 4
MYSREEHLQKKVDEIIKEAKLKMGKGDKKGALFAMKRKKLYEQEQDKIANVKMTLETQVISLESAAQNAQTFQAMQAGTKTMAKIRNDVGIEQVDDVMDEIKEEMEMAQEINDAIAQPVDSLLFADEDDLLAELNMLETADLEAELLKPPPTSLPTLSLPDAPQNKLPALAKREEDDLKALEAELAGL